MRGGGGMQGDLRKERDDFFNKKIYILFNKKYISNFIIKENNLQYQKLLFRKDVINYIILTLKKQKILFFQSILRIFVGLNCA